MFGTAAPVASLRVTPPPNEDADEEMDFADFNSMSLLSLKEEPYPRVLSPISGLAENLSHLSTRTPTPPQPSVAVHLCSASHAVKLRTAARIRGDDDDKENHENVIRSPKAVSPSRKTFPRTIEKMADEEEEELQESPRTRRSSVNMLYNSDDTDQLRRLLQPPEVEVASKLHTSLPELPVLDCPSPASIETTNIILKRLPSRTRGRSSTGPRIRPGEQKKQHKSLQERIVKSRPSSPALSPCTSPSVAPRMLSPAMSSNGNLRQRRVIPSLIPTLQIPCPGSDEPVRRKNTLTKSPRTSPRSSLMINSSEVLLEASPKRTAWTKRQSLLRSEGALPISNMPAFPFDPKNKKTLNNNDNTHNNNNNMAVPFVFNARKDTWIKSQLGSLQGEFHKEFLTTASASQSDGELAEDELKGLEQEGEEEEDEESGPIRRSVSEMDISMAIANQRKRKFSKRCGTTLPSSFQSHCEQVRAEQSCKIPTIVSTKHPDLDVIEASTLVRMLQGEFSEHFSQIFIIDCRFPYEFDGGHVVGAVNLHTPQHIESAFPVAMCSEQNESEKKPAIIFHCEFSSERGPKQYRHLRKLDREVNYNVYPKLYYPHLFLLSGGYKEFFQTTKGELCEPKDYVEMRDARFLEEMKKHSAEQKKRCLKKFRSQSYSCLLTYMGSGGGGKN